MAEQQPPVQPDDADAINSDNAAASSSPVPQSNEAIVDNAAIPDDAPMPDASAGQADDAPDASDADDDLGDGLNFDQATIDELLKQASFDDPASLPADADEDPSAEADRLDLPNFNEVIRDAQVSSIDLLRDVELDVKIELGRSHMLVEDVLKLGEGSVVELDKLAGDPVDVFVNGRLVARGEVLVLNDNFCVRINEIVQGMREEGA